MLWLALLCKCPELARAAETCSSTAYLVPHFVKLLVLQRPTILRRRTEAPALDQARRRVLLGAAAFVALPVWEGRAAWDGSSAAVGSCPLGEEGDECRVQTLKCALCYSSPSCIGSVQNCCTLW